MGGRKNDNKEKNKNKKDKNVEEDDNKGRQNKRKEKRHKQKNWQDSDEFLKHLKEFNEEVSKYNLYIRDVQGDGNCLFRSVADQLEGDENMHVYYRKVAVEQMKKQSDFFKNFVFDIDFDQYLHEMSSLCTWGGNLEIQALSAALGHNFIIHMKGRPYLAIKGKAVKGIKKRTVHLAYHTEDDSEEHYSSIRNIGDDEKEQPAQPIKNEMFKLLEKQMNKDDGIDYDDEQEEENNQQNENNNHIGDSLKEQESTQQTTQKKGSKQTKIDLAKDRKEKSKAKKLSKTDKKEAQQPIKTHKKKANLGDQKTDEEDNENNQNSSNSENEQEEEEEKNNINQQQGRLSKELQKRKEEKQIKDMIKQVANMQLNEKKQDQDDEESNSNKVGRNQKCHCGSLKAYKKCCESKDEASKKMKKKKEQDNLDSIKEVVFI